MNILYISALEGGKYSGPFYSVPKQIDAQKNEDRVYWVNLTNIEFDNLEHKKIYNYIDWKRFSLKLLPDPFCKPDLVVFEEFYKIENCVVARKIEKHNIPYIIIPRCQMTKKYLKNKSLKKKIANILLFNHFSNKSIAVQFLSNNEYEESKDFYNGEYEIIPNGIDHIQNRNKKNKNEEVNCVFIGRYSVWQKGLDLLINAIKKIEKDLIANNFKFKLYGPNERTGNKDEIINLVRKNNLEKLIFVNGPVFNDAKKDVLEQADLFVHTSRFEGLPMAVLEALSYEIPCVVTDGSNIRNEIEKFDAGWTSDTTVDGIENMLLKVIKEKKLINMKGKNAKMLSEEYFWENIAQKTHGWYKDLLKKD